MDRTPIKLRKQSAPLSGSFGLGWAKRMFGEEVISSLPVYTEGSNIGKPIGFVQWRKAQLSGYCQEIDTVVNWGGLVDAWLSNGPDDLPEQALKGPWKTEEGAIYGDFRELFEDNKLYRVKP